MSATIKSETTFSTAAGQVLEQLFHVGPTLADDLISQAGRNELISLGLVVASGGWSTLTRQGLETAIAAGTGEMKQAADIAEAKAQDDAKMHRDLLLRSISAVVLSIGGEVVLPYDAVFNELGACLMDQPDPASIRLRYYTEADAVAAIAGSRAAAEAARVAAFEREQSEGQAA